MKVEIKFLHTSPRGKEYLLTLPGGLSKLVQISRQDSIIHRMSEKDVLYNLASDFVEQHFGILENFTIEGDV